METRPEIKIPFSLTDQVITIAGGSVIIFLWVVTIAFFIKMPERIPIHFDAAGKVNGHGSREFIFLMPAIGTVIFVAFLYLSKVPHLFNYKVTITEENAVLYYTNSSRMIKVTGISTALLMVFIVFSIGSASRGNSSLIGALTVPVLIVLFLLPTAYYLLQMAWMKKGKKQE